MSADASNQATGPESWSLESLNSEVSDAFLSFFELLIEVDRRKNPDFYKAHNPSETSDK